MTQSSLKELCRVHPSVCMLLYLSLSIHVEYRALDTVWHVVFIEPMLWYCTVHYCIVPDCPIPYQPVLYNTYNNERGLLVIVTPL